MRKTNDDRAQIWSVLQKCGAKNEILPVLLFASTVCLALLICDLSKSGPNSFILTTLPPNALMNDFENVIFVPDLSGCYCFPQNTESRFVEC